MMWVWDHLEPISIEEYEYWMLHVLPFGWSIISKPLPEEFKV
jgi:hypothetical protein